MTLLALVVFCHTLGFISSIHAVMSTRTSQGAIAWVVSLNTFPYVAVPAYWVLGRSRFHGYDIARRSLDVRQEQVEQHALERLAPFRLSEFGHYTTVRAVEALGRMPALGGNRVDLLIDGDATFASILDGIDQAEDYILFQFFIVKDDGLGRRVKDRLIARAKAGVRVYFLYDEVGSHELPDRYLEDLREVGIEVTEFDTRKGKGNRFQVNFRNHRKIVVVDGKLAWIGGLNVGDEYLGKDPKFGHWRDSHVRIEGPAVLEAQVSFAADWRWAKDEVPKLRWQAEAAPDDSDAGVLIIPSGPADELETANLMFVHAISSARKRIWIASPYFVPDRSLIVALQLAGLRGLDVRILIPDNPDHLLVYLAAYSYFDEAGRTGVRFYRYTKGFLHEKAMLIDDGVATIGTANFDNRSFRLNFEITVAISDPAFVAQVEKMFVDDFSDARLMEEGEYDRKPWWFRFVVRLARLTSPIQ
jgi:cardiolipin synthase